MKITTNYEMLQSFAEEDWMEYLRLDGDCNPEIIRGLTPIREYEDGLHTYSWELPNGDWIMQMFADHKIIFNTSVVEFLIEKGVIRIEWE